MKKIIYWLRKFRCWLTGHDLNPGHKLCQYCFEVNPNYFPMKKVNGDMSEPELTKEESVGRRIAWDRHNDITLV